VLGTDGPAVGALDTLLAAFLVRSRAFEVMVAILEHLIFKFFSSKELTLFVSRQV
jgi:hypothetical protein